MCGAIPSHPQYAFTAWCSLKAQGQLYLTLPLRGRKWWEAGEDCVMRSFIT